MFVSLSNDHSFSHWHEIQRIIDAHSLRQAEMFVARQNAVHYQLMMQKKIQ